MALILDIAATYRSPRAVIRRLLASGPREDRALVYLILACGMIFVAQWPRLQREAYFDPSIPLDARIGAALLAWVFVAPLVLYAIAALAHLIARILGGKGTGYGARLALFWSLLVAAPVWLLHGLAAAFIGPGVQLDLVGGLALSVFFLCWGMAMYEAESTDLRL